MSDEIIYKTFKKLDKEGRVLIPFDIRDKMKLEEGDAISIVLTTENKLIITKGLYNGGGANE